MGKKGNKRKTRWRVLPIGGDEVECLYSTNEDDADGDHAVSSATTAHGPGSYARAAQPGRGKLGSKPRTSSFQSSYYNRPHRSAPDSRQPLVTTEKKTFNEEEYTKITTPRQDVLFKKGYLGRKKAVANAANAATVSDATAPAVAGVTLTANNIDVLSMHNGGDCEMLQGEQNEAVNSADEQPQYIYTNGYMDGVIYVNGGYEWYDPYNNVTVLVGPPPHFAAPGAAPPVLAAVPCQPLPLQPLEWFNPTYGMPYVASTMHPCHRERDRRKRYSADSQNCSPQSSECTDPPGSPQEGEGDGEVDGEGDGDGECEVDGDGEGECRGEGEREFEIEGDCEGKIVEGMLPELPNIMNVPEEYAVYTHAHSMQPHPSAAPQAYVYPGAYMFGQPIYNMNGISVQSTSQLQQNTDNLGSKRRKKKRRRRRRRGGVEDGSEETSSEEKELEDPAGATSQESSQEVELECKSSVGSGGITGIAGSTGNTESASCSTIVGGPELPETTPESQSTSPSLSPSLPSSPSPSNITDKTALSNADCVRTNDEKESSRSDCPETAGSLAEVSEEGLDNNNLQVAIFPKHDNENNLHDNEDPSIDILIPKCENSFSANVVNNECKVNGNHLALHESNKTFELDNNCEEINNFELSNDEHSKNSSLTFTETSCNKVLFARQKSKNKKGLKLNKQKALDKHHTFENGILPPQIKNCSPKGDENIEMDGNEKIKSSTNCPTSSSEILMKQKCFNGNKDAPSPTALHESSSESSGLTIETPKKPARTHQHRQIKVQTTETTSKPLQKINHSSNLSSADEVENSVSDSNIVLTEVHIQSDFQFDKSIDQNNSKESKSPFTDDDDDDKHSTKSTSNVVTEVDITLKQEVTACVNKEQNVMKEDKVHEEIVTHLDKSSGKTSRVISKDDGAYSEIKFDSNRDQNISSKLIQVHRNEGECSLSNWPAMKSESQALADAKDVQKSSQSEINDITPPIPPPRRKKCQSSRLLVKHLPEGKESDVKKQALTTEINSKNSSQTEESIIDLKTSSNNYNEHLESLNTNTNSLVDATVIPEDVTTITEDIRSVSAESANINFECDRESKDYIAEAANIKSTDSGIILEDTELCISYQPEQILKGDQETNKYSKNESLLADEAGTASYEHGFPGPLTCINTKSYAEDFASQLLTTSLSTAITSLNRPGPSLSLTEAVTQWLHSQDSEELLQVPQLNDSESEVELGEEEIMTGPKNVHRNPLLAQSCNTKIESDCAGIRVANHTNSNLLFNELEYLCKSDVSYLTNVIGENEYIKTEILLDQYGNGMTINDGIRNISHIVPGDELFINNSNMNNDISDTESTMEKCLLEYEESDRLSVESPKYVKNQEQNLLKFPSFQICNQLYDQMSCTILEPTDNNCSLICDPTISVKKYYSLGADLPERDRKENKSSYTNSPNDTDTGGGPICINDVDSNDEYEHEDYYIDDNKQNIYSVANGNGDYSEDDDKNKDEEIDALIVFRNELIENTPCTSEENNCKPRRNRDKRKELPLDSNESFSGFKENCISSFDGSPPDSGIYSEESCNESNQRKERVKSISEINRVLKRKSAILLSQWVAEGPLPCGGICCILQ